MKKTLIFAAVLSFFMVTQTGCFSSTDTGNATTQVITGSESEPGSDTPESQGKDQTPEKSDQEPAADVNVPGKDEPSTSLTNVVKWVDLYEDSENPELAAVYDEAFAIIKKGSNISGTILKQSAHFGSWYQIVIKTDSDSEQIPDAPTGYNSAFLVDMSKQAVIAKGDFKSASVLISRLIELGHENSSNGTGEFIETTASVISSIGFNHSGYAEESAIDGFHIPQQSKDASGVSRLEYFVVDGISDGMIRCVLTVKDGNITFEHSNMP